MADGVEWFHTSNIMCYLCVMLAMMEGSGINLI